MTASEIAFLSLGLMLGIVSGAALIEVVRNRPRAPREIRLTVTPDSVPRRRSATLAENAFVMPGPEPAKAGPGDRRQVDRAGDPDADARTNVRSPGGSAGGGEPDPRLAASRVVAQRPLAPRASSIAGGIGGGAIAIPIYREIDWTLRALRSAAADVAERAIRDQRLTAAAILERGAPTAVAASSSQDDGTGAGAADAARPTDAAGGGTSEDPADPCGEARRVSEERCNVATRARVHAQTAHDALRAAQRAYDEHHILAEQAAAEADQRAIRAAKETAQHGFRDSRTSAGTREEVEGAARDWLNEINRINRSAREAAAAVQRERDAATGLVMSIERLTVEADAARISAEAADAACVTARQAVADCHEAAVADRASTGADRTSTAWPPAHSVGQGGGRPGLPDDDESELEAAFTATGEGEPAILRLVRGDRAALGRVVSELAGDDAAERRRWQLAIANLVDSIVARSIEASALTFPIDHPFWGSFDLAQNRDIVAALSSLGYRFDGLGGWSDERIPSQRDLSLAVGYAGLDPMRIRPWPTEHEMTELFREVAVAADEYLADAAGGLTLGELVSLLGRRADGLADLWNEWGRVRPLLLSGG